MLKSTPLLLALTLAATASHAADNCEVLRAQIEAHIASKGVEAFTVTTVDAAATALGQVVGSCDNGAKKIVYARSSGAPSVAPTAPAAAVPAAAPAQRPVAPPKAVKKASREQDILTECKDGTVSMGGSCK